MKKFLAIVLAAVMALSMVSFATADGETYDIKIWVAEAAKDLTEKQIADFNANNEFGFKFNATIQMITDVEAGGDIYCFAQDQFARLVQAGALDALGKKASETVIANNDAGTVAAATSGEQVYAYPLTADNGYFMYYDKSVIPDEDVDSLEKLIADCEAAQKYFAFEMQTSAWYLASFFFATGCRRVWVTDDNGEFISVSDTFDSDNGLIAVKGMKKLVDSPYHLSGGGADQFNQNAAVLVSGTWDFAKVQEYLGDNMGVTDLPSFEVDGKEYHLGSFNGCKLLGVKPQVDEMKGAAIHKLAQYLTGAQCQMERFEALAWGPSNLEDQASEAVQANPGLAALIKQAPYSVPQGQIHGSWWDIAKVIGEDVKNATDEAGLQAALDNYQDKIASLFTMSDEVKNAWTAIGTINGTNWDADVTMTKGDDGVWKTEALELHAGEEFKVRQGLSWDNNFPAENFKVEADGTYVITFDEAATTVDIVAQ